MIALVGAMGCAEQPIGHPMAFFTVSPRHVCAGDAHQTTVRVDAEQSSPTARLIIGGEEPDKGDLELRWSVQSSDYKVVKGGLDTSELAFTLNGDRPVTVALTVTNENGESGTDENTVGLIYPSATACADDGDCGMNETCAPFKKGSACLPTQRCDADTDCPACYRCDSAMRWCIP